MALVETNHRSGLVIAEEAAGESRLRRELKQLDRRLRLLSPAVVFPGTATGYWRVVCVVSESLTIPILAWSDADGNPIPLTARIVDEVKRLRIDGRHVMPSVDERNAQHVEGIRRQRDANREALHDEYAPYLERERVTIGMSTRTRKPYWQRRYRGGER